MNQLNNSAYLSQKIGENANQSNPLKSIWNQFDDIAALKSNPLDYPFLNKNFNPFCPGPYILFITDFPSQEIEFINSRIEDKIGIKANAINFANFLPHLHPQDTEFMLAAERKIF